MCIISNYSERDGAAVAVAAITRDHSQSAVAATAAAALFGNVGRKVSRTTAIP